MDPEAAAAFYRQHFPTLETTTFAGLVALRADDVLLVFSKVSTPAPYPQSAYWHFGWHVVSSRDNYALYAKNSHDTLLPLHTSDDGATVFLNTDSWPGMRTRGQIADALARGLTAEGGGGWAYLRGPDNLIVEYRGDFSRERFNHVHLWQEHPICADRWYQRHLLATAGAYWPVADVPRPGPGVPCEVPRGEPTWPSLESHGTIRFPPGGVRFGDVDLFWYPNQTERPLASSRGQTIDHIGLAVADLDAWVAKLTREGVTLLDEPYSLGDLRGVMIEGPSREAIELVEVP